MTKTAAEVIREARNILFERGWHQGSLRGPGRSVCIESACRTADLFGEMHDEAWGAVRAAIDEEYGQGQPWWQLSPSWWNDHVAESLDDVLAVLDKAEKIAEAQEASSPPSPLVAQEAKT